MATKIGWKCIIPGCKSSAKSPGHYFPKNNDIIKKWLEVVSVPWLLNLPEEEIRKCRICHLHFSENSYIFSLNRRRLKHNAIPSQNLSSSRVETDITQPSTSQESTREIDMQSNEMSETIEIDISQPSTSQKSTREIDMQFNEISETIEIDISQPNANH
ncbi:hypothetical protein ALC57_09329 [Trachymyrmex cornetzi]|uniref:THAP-type domain-containing protein n=1 Tax=Trachymyrmex cornetzi TaxID=471704 RepID=A0A151J5J4_9HYME|nr:hypothetical protein ALC57_09329 [Trachymyrmex cornetzi]